MRNKKVSSVIFMIFVSMVWTSQSSPFEKPTHQAINETIAERTINGFSLNDYLLKQIGLLKGIKEPLKIGSEEKTVQKWLGIGGIKEDEPEQKWDQVIGKARNINHFHNPLGGPLLVNDGLDDTYVFHYTGQSSILWAQNRNQDPGGKWSWYDARNYFYDGLTWVDQSLRDSAMANCFRALGQLMHLVEDASVPAHSRNSIHPFFSYEPWLEAIRTSRKEKGTFDNFIANPTSFDPSILNLPVLDSSAPIPIANIIDTDKYSGSNPDITASTAIGIAEYANANFFSERTVFSNAFPYPARTSVEKIPYLMMDPRGTGTSVTRDYYVKVRDGEKNYRLATVGFLKYYITKYFPAYLLILNPKEALDGGVYSDYASLLLPRAVGYSAGLLQYFFRGNIEITLPDSGVYAQTAKPDDGFTQVKFKARNTTPNGEEMTGGTIELVVKYKDALENPFQSKEVATSADFRYIVVPEANGVRSIPRVPEDQPKPQELVFDLSSSPIPLYATDVYLQVVYHGKLGQMINGGFVGEDLGVAVGFKDISEPTPIDIFNDMDRICINGGWCVAGDAASQTYGIDAYPHNLIDSYIRLSSLNNPQVVSPANYNFYIQQIAPGTYSRVFILGDYAGSNISYTGSGQKISGSDTWPHIPGVLCPPGYTTLSPCSDVYKLIKNQTDIANGIANRVYPTFNLFRGVTTWGGGAVENWPYPANSVCPE
jgi:hypothetical protein